MTTPLSEFLADVARGYASTPLAAIRIENRRTTKLATTELSTITLELSDFHRKLAAPFDLVVDEGEGETRMHARSFDDLPDLAGRRYLHTMTGLIALALFQVRQPDWLTKTRTCRPLDGGGLAVVDEKGRGFHVWSAASLLARADHILSLGVRSTHRFVPSYLT